ncbi:hypothetical protein ZWY2020_000241 [Hordeum vulgare]|nr:hypothetical protein ZWY2020_000241 [Hordeum vulgare]
MKKKGGRNFLGFMVKEEKEENRGSVEFQVFSFTNKIRRGSVGSLIESFFY